MLRVGSRGEQVREVQTWLGLAVDGIYGTATADAVKAYQSRHGLGVDGIAGAVTLAHMKRTLGQPGGTGGGGGSGGSGSGGGTVDAGTLPPVQSFGVPIYPNGEIALGHLDPTAPAVELPDNLDGIVRPAAVAIASSQLNRSFNVKGTGHSYNPFQHNDLVKKAAVGARLPAYTSGDDLFESKALIPVRQFIGGAAAAQGSAFAASLAPLLVALPEEAVLRRPAHRYSLAGGTGTRVAFFGGKAGHREIDAITREMGRQHLRLMKEWVHFADIPLNETAQGGRIPDILANKYTIAGGSHLGALSLGWRDGKTITVKSDWGNYDDPSDKFPHYGIQLFAIDYQAGAQDPIPDATLAAYKQNADMWDCFAAMVAPFHTDHTDHKFEDREKFNSLEACDQASLADFATTLATLNKETFDKKYAGFYCAEAHYVIANLGPQEATLLKKSRFGDSEIARYIERFQAAYNTKAYRDKSQEWRRQNPQIGWAALNSGGFFRSRLLRRSDYAHFNSVTQQTGVYLDWIPEDVKGWQAYRPLNEEGLVASPATVGSIAWAVCRLYMPREAIADLLVNEILEAYGSGDASVKRAVETLSNRQDPRQGAGRRELAGFASVVASQSLAAVLRDPNTKSAILASAALEELVDDSERRAVERLYDEFVTTLQGSVLAGQEQLDAQLRALDRKAAAMRVKRNTRTVSGRQTGRVRSSLMVYVPPGMWAYWAQQPFLSRSTSVRYVATVLHESLKSPLA
ncbi:MAG: hypothetical protein GC150_16965 [Rhizobiales bacterium]|nr:hypothetical protein [Hyphomicrobiales bacterium]